ncbi:MAG: hypothetical protein HYZ14_04205 [Bacteroidetes bacterium]|nr:hypothetical protein [Bacteroidota bacterium]
MKSITLKEVGIVTGYIILLIGIIVYEWKPFSLFLSFIVEYSIILVVYAFLWLHRGVSKRSDEPPLLYVLLAGFAFGLFQGGLLLFIVRESESGAAWRDDQSDLGWTITALAIPIAIFHFVPVISRLKDPTIMDERRSLIFTSAIAFLATNFGGLIAFTIFKDSFPKAVVVVMVSLRIFFEVWMTHFQKPNRT